MIISAETFPHAAGKGLEGFPDPVAVAIAAAGGLVGTVQNHTTTLSNVEGSAGETISPAVDPALTIGILRGVDVQASETLPESYSCYIHLVPAGNSVTVSRFNTGIAVDVYFTLIEFTSGINVKHSEFLIGSGSASGTQSLTALDTTKTIIIPTGVKVHGATQDAQVFSPWWVLTNSTTATVTRNTTGTAITVAASIVEFL